MTGTADPHCHTSASDGMVSPAELVAAAVSAGLDLIAITDHDTMAAAGEVAARGAEAGLEVVKGEEVTTRWPGLTHVVAWFLEAPVRSGMSLAGTVAAIHEQGGLAVIPHPFMPTYFASCQPAMLERLIAVCAVDAIEVVHTAPTTPARSRQLQRFYAANQARLGAAVGGSDCHFGIHDIGRAVTRYPGRTAADFRRAVEERTTWVERRPHSRVPGRLLARQQVRSLVELPVRRVLGKLQ